MTNKDVLAALRDAYKGLNMAGDAMIETQEYDSVELDEANQAIEYAIRKVREVMGELE